MTSKSLWIALLTLAFVPLVMAAGSSSTSRPPDRPRAQPSDYDVGVKAVQAGDYQRALGSLQKVVQADPRNADAWNYIGFSQRNLHHFDESLAAYQKALAINPDHRGANEYLGELYLKTGDLEKARAQLSKLQSLCPTGCSEYDDLRKAVGAHQPAAKKT
jgi:tetratricopeptide (TPR) repeat protein